MPENDDILVPAPINNIPEAAPALPVAAVHAPANIGALLKKKVIAKKMPKLAAQVVLGDVEAPFDDDAPDDGWDGPPIKKKKMFAPAPLPVSKHRAPGNMSREVLHERARKMPKPKNVPNHNNDHGCQQCGCAYRQHSSSTNCSRCDNCPGGYLYQEQVQRVYFHDFLKWARIWIKGSKKRDVKKLRDIWGRIRQVGHLSYCGTCDAANFSNDMHGLVKRQDGLQCSSCRQCSSCCKCVSCETCKRRKRAGNICKTCNVCDSCCQCMECPVCSRDCSHNYCGYTFTMRQQKLTPGCKRCYGCCDCGDFQKVPFGAFSKPIFHKPGIKQRVENPTSRFLSAEIECAGIQGFGTPIYDVVRKWSGGTVGDGSLADKGFEVNTAPAGGDLYVKQIKDICEAIKLQKGYIDHRCGLHVHIDARDMNFYDIRRLVRAYASIEDALFAMVSPQRLEGVTDADGKLHQYCQPCGKKYVAAIEEGRLPYDKVKTDVITSIYSVPSTQNLRYKKRGAGIPRYNALNLHSWFYRGTIETRMFDGCIEPEPIINWGIMWALIIDYSVKCSDEQVGKDMTGRPLASLAKIVAGHKNILDFIKQRVLMFGNQQMQRDANELL